MLFSRVKLIVLALVVASPGGAQIVAAQQCDEVCQSGTDCSTGCYHSSIYSTCGQHGTCYQITNSCAAICGSGQALCQEGCYTGQYPDFASSNCEMAGYSCTVQGPCESNWLTRTDTVSRWQWVENIGTWDPYYVCHLYETRQHVLYDDECGEPDDPQDCWVVEINFFTNSQSCCYGCYGSPWPASCS